MQPPSFGWGQANKQARLGQFSSLEDIGRATGDFLYNSALAAQYMAQLEAQARREAQAQQMARREAQAEREARASYAVARYARIPVFSCLRVLMCVCVRLAFRVSAMQ